MAIPLKNIKSNLYELAIEFPQLKPSATSVGKELTSELETLRCELVYLKSKLRDVYEGKASLRLDADDAVRFDSLPEAE